MSRFIEWGCWTMDELALITKGWEKREESLPDLETLCEEAQKIIDYVSGTERPLNLSLIIKVVEHMLGFSGSSLPLLDDPVTRLRDEAVVKLVGAYNLYPIFGKYASAYAVVAQEEDKVRREIQRERLEKLITQRTKEFEDFVKKGPDIDDLLRPH